jgi:SRSO17 transposase
VREDLTNYVLQRLGKEKAVLIVDETSYLKKSKQSVDVKCQTRALRKGSRAVRWVLPGLYNLEGPAFIDHELFLREK